MRLEQLLKRPENDTDVYRHSPNGPRLNVERGFTDNDKWFSGGFYGAGLAELTYKVKDFKVTSIARNVVRVSVTTECMGTKNAGFMQACDYTIFSNGCIVVGSTWYFQSWFRDKKMPCGTKSNLSNALKVEFTP